MLDLRKVFPRNVRGKLMDAFWWLPDKAYVQLFYFACNWKLLNLRNPKTFAEKLNWLKFHDQHPEYAKLADKLAVREYIKEEFGEQYIFPIYGQWKSFDEIPFDDLPEQFVLKCNHDSGSVKLIRSKSSLSKEDMAELKKFYDRRLKWDAFYSGREFPYKGIDRYVFAEKFMQSEARELETFQDYKFLCFNGEPKLVYIESERSVGVKMDVFDMDFTPIKDIHGDKPQSGQTFDKPNCFEEMKAMATKLCQGIKFVRIDFRVLDGKVYFGEFTFYDNGGFRDFKPKEWDLKLASWIPTD